MRVSILQEIGRVELVDWDDPVPGPHEVVIRLKSVGVCGSDIHYWKHGRIGSGQVVTEPIIMGHEPAGVIESVGSEVTRVAPGDRVAVEPGIVCNHCPRCLEGRPNLCPDIIFLGTPPYHGAYREKLVMPEQNVFAIPDDMSFDVAALLEPFAIGLHAANLAGIMPGDRVAVVGCGPVGLCTLAAAKLKGAADIVASDRIEARLEMARRLGATHTVNVDEMSMTEVVDQLTDGLGLDCSLEAAGNQEAVDDAAAVVRRGGTTCIIGIPSVEQVSFPVHEVRRKELTIQNVRRSNLTLERAIELCATGRVELSPLATHSYELTGVEEAFKLVDAYADGVVKAMIHP